MNKNKSEKFKESLKSWDTENFLDRHFYRPVAYKFAVLLKNTNITPNSVTIISIFVGIGACLMFYPENLVINLLGFCILVFANILDCVDGQLARLTGIKSELGRILDGLCGDIWFLTLYTVLTLRLINGEGWGWWTILIAFASTVSHLTQAGMVDYYKTLHIHFLKGGINSEFVDSDAIKVKYKSLSWKEAPLSKLFMKLYQLYTMNQEFRKPNLKRLMEQLKVKYPDGYPEDIILKFREKSLKMMPLLDSFTFNARSVVILATLILNIVWIYFAIEILILNPLLVVAIRRHEKMCLELTEK